MSVLRIDLLGKFAVSVDGNRHPQFRLNKSKALLAYLAMHPDQPVSRATLANLLWSDRADQQARRSLRQALSILKIALEEVGVSPLVTSNATVALDTTAALIDVSKFTALSGLEDAASLTKAATLYEGDFLDGFDAACPQFEDWTGEIKRALREVAISTLTKLLRLNAANGLPKQAIANAERLTVLDPFAEQAHRALMRLYVEIGQSGKALRQFELCRDLLKRELDVPPEAETLALANRIRRDRSATISPPAPGSCAPSEIMSTSRSTGKTPGGLPADRARFPIPLTQAGLRTIVLAGVISTTLGLIALAVQPQSGGKIAQIGLGTSILSQNSVNAHAMNAYLNGQKSFREQSPEGLVRALEYYKLAVEFDPDFARAEAALANAHLQVYLNNWHALAGLPRSGDAFNMAVERAEKLLLRDAPPALAHTVLAKALYFGPSRPVQYDNAIAQAHRAIAFDPDNSQAFLGLGEILIHSGAPEQAISHYEMAAKLDPGNAGLAAYGLALAYFHIERFDKALVQIEIALEASPDAYSMWALAAIIRGHLGQIGIAQMAFTQAVVLGREQGQGANSSIWPAGAEYYRRTADFERLVTGIKLVCGPTRFKI